MIDNDPLAARLKAIDIATPSFRVERQEAPRQAPVFVRVRRRRVGILLAVALLVLGLAATYSTIGADGLRWVGLNTSQVQPLTGTVTNGKARMTVAGGYADDINTVLFIGFENMGCPPYLTDQFGERYEVQGGVGEGVGPFPAIFDPLRGRAATEGARITVHCHFPGERDMTIQLTGTLVAHRAHSLELPAPVVVDGTTYQVVGLRWSGTYLEVRTRISGKLIAEISAGIEEMKHNPCPAGCGVGFPGVYLVPPEGGSRQIPTTSLYDPAFMNRVDKDRVDEETRIFPASRPGKYTIVVTRDDPKKPAIASWTVEVR